MIIDYCNFYKRKYSPNDKVGDRQWDLFISAYNNSERVREVYKKINARRKHWLVMPDYEYKSNELPESLTEECYLYKNDEAYIESEYIKDYIAKINKNKLSNLSICIDITGFMRPHLLFLFRYFFQVGVKNVDVIYSDPIMYMDKGKQQFTKDEVYDVRQVQGFEGAHITNSSNDLMIIGSGYDEKLITAVSKDKANSRKIQIFGFPSLQPDMFQENLLRAYIAEEAIGTKFINNQNAYYAPANDPFVTAAVIREIVTKENRKNKITNLYLCPLSTKAQTIGFLIYYLWECMEKPVSIIFPFCKKYTKETTQGISRIWLYTIEMPVMSTV
jgi:hypothetical protein